VFATQVELEQARKLAVAAMVSKRELARTRVGVATLRRKLDGLHARIDSERRATDLELATARAGLRSVEQEPAQRLPLEGHLQRPAGLLEPP
jgi:hypothetical protein